MDVVKIWLGLFLLTFVASGNIVAKGRPYIINFSKEKYGADNKNWSVDQDEKGIMYFGNDIGLLEFDGVSWRLNSLPNNLTVRSVSVLSHHTLFTGSYEEFGRWDRDLSGRLTYTSLSANLDRSLFKNDDVWKIWANDEFVYFQSFSSVFFYDYEKIERIPFEGGILFLTKVRDEYWVQQMKGGIFRLRGKSVEKIEGSDLFRHTDVRVILPYLSDQYLIGTATEGIFIYDGKTFEPWNGKLSETMSAVDLNCGLLTSRGTYVFGTILEGIYEVTVKGETVNHISTDNVLQNNTVLSVFEDNAGHIWLGLDRGISYLQYLPKMNYYQDPRGNIGSTYDAVLWDNTLFLGTNQGVFCIEEKDMFASNILPNMRLIEGSQGQVWSFYIDSGRLFCCHNRGLKEIHKNRTISDPYKLTTGVYRMTKVKLKEKHSLLISAYTSLKIKEAESDVIHDLKGVEEPIIYTAVDHLENVWLEHFNKGVYRCRLTDDLRAVESNRYFGGSSGDGLPYKLKIFKVKERIVLLGDSKFFAYDDISDTIVPDKRLNDCFSHIQDIRKIVHIQGSLYWALTGSSIYKFSYDGYNANIIESYDIGTHNLSLVNAYEHISILNDSVNLVCLDNGFLIYDNKTNLRNVSKTLDIPFIQSLEISNIAEGKTKFTDPSKSGKIPYNYNTITIRFLAKNTLASNYYFQYMLEGVDKNWSEAQKINNLSYARLSDGVYTLKIRTVDNLGNHSEMIRYDFEVLPPWFRSAWAYIAYVFGTIGVLLFIWTIVLRRYRNIHLMKIRNRETKRLRRANEQLKQTIQEKNAALLTQTFFVVQRNDLLLKIKAELEDYYKKQNNKSLAPLFNKVNMLLTAHMNTEEDWKMFLINFEQKHTGMFKKLKADYPNLTANDLKLCACLKLNLDSKEIASLMNISVRAVENNRSRLRKKLKIPSSQHLSEFFIRF